MEIICLDDSESLLPHGIILGQQGLEQSHRIALKPIRQNEKVATITCWTGAHNLTDGDNLLDDSESLLPHGIILGPQGLYSSNHIV